MNTTVWIFHGEGSQISSGVFSSIEEAEIFISRYKLSGVLSIYPVGISVYDWAIEKDFFEPKKEHQKESSFIQSFTTASQEHYHYENGQRD
jgi:hypothetical protein